MEYYDSLEHDDDFVTDAADDQEPKLGSPSIKDLMIDFQYRELGRTIAAGEISAAMALDEWDEPRIPT